MEHSSKSGSESNGINCTGFEALLAEAVEGALEPATMQRFRSHAADCANCAPLFAEALAGYQWMAALEETPPPAHLVHNILAATSGSALDQARGQTAGWRSWAARTREWTSPVFAPLLQPRVAGSLAMAFFSVTLLFNLIGVRVSDLRHLDLRPSAVRSGVSRQYYEASAKVVKYYDSMRFVYELQSRVRDIKTVALPQEGNSKPEKKEKTNKDISDQPEQRQEKNQNYSRAEGNLLLAGGIVGDVAPAGLGVQDRREA